VNGVAPLSEIVKSPNESRTMNREMVAVLLILAFLLAGAEGPVREEISESFISLARWNLSVLFSISKVLTFCCRELFLDSRH